MKSTMNIGRNHFAFLSSFPFFKKIFKTESCFIAHTLLYIHALCSWVDLEFTAVFLPQPSKYWDYICALLSLTRDMYVCMYMGLFSYVHVYMYVEARG